MKTYKYQRPHPRPPNVLARTWMCSCILKLSKKGAVQPRVHVRMGVFTLSTVNLPRVTIHCALCIHRIIIKRNVTVPTREASALSYGFGRLATTGT
jgi:hypothetical protein